MSGFCGQCGAAKATADQRFCQGCGAGFTSPGAPPDATPAAAPFTPPPPPTAAAALPQAFGPPAPVDYAVPARLPERSGGPSVGRILGIGAAVLALAAGGLVAWQVLGPSGGAATPEDAVRQFVTAAADQDVVGALKVVNPGEVEGLDSLYTAARSRAEEESLVRGEGAVTDALTVALTDLDLDVEELSEGAAYVTLRDGDYTVRYDPGELPDRFDFIADAHPEAQEWSGDIREIFREEMYLDYEPGLTTVKVGGGWYVTAVGTVIDNVLRDEFDDLRNLRDYEVGEPDYDAVVEEVEPIVGEDPEEALANLAEAVAGEDFEQLLANFPADQVVALRPYVRLVEDSLAYEGTSLDAVVTDLDLTESDAGGNLVKVTIGEATMLGTMHQNGATFTGEVAVDGRCFDGTGYEEYDGYQDYDEGRFCLDGDVVDYTGIDEVYVMMRQVGGGYQVDLLATAIAYAQAAIEAVPSSAFDRALSEICYEVQDYDSTGCPS